MADLPSMRKEHNWKMGNIHIAITVSVNEVYMKASSAWMKNSEFDIHVEQLDSLIRERMRGAWA